MSARPLWLPKGFARAAPVPPLGTSQFYQQLSDQAAATAGHIARAGHLNLAVATDASPSARGQQHSHAGLPQPHGFTVI